MPQADDTLAHLASISLPSHSPAPSQYTPHLAPAFTRIYDALENLKHASTASSHASAAQTQAFLELERTVRALNAGIVDDVQRAVEEGVRKGVREGMEGMVLRVEWKEPGVGCAHPQPQPQAQQGQGQQQQREEVRAAPVNATAGPSRPANNTSSPTAWNLSGLTGLGNLSSAAETSQLSSLFSLAQQSQQSQSIPHPAVHTPSHPHPHPIPPSSDTPLSSFSLSTPSQNFTMSREVKSVPDLWKEYTIGWDGQPAVRDIYEGNPRKRRRGKRFRDDSERKFYRRRKKVLEMVEALVEKGVGEEEAVDRVERLRERRKCTLNKLGEIIPEMTSEEIALV
ncbi:hypothetical protein L198_00022 [Cryptococcus wingfieldii CBS 7118]|uniref:Transcription activator GCR1-like domain-containing protein n=1 Tax=Cryptococcus wingfieldii CBS 7118 TaxID=1295528 RepID=A0A1E3K5E5_9TREE|nr:hypothetical protein L198_00022 [Cryptococcus wingfieldii CBS 7118]ODO08299.1 hypothetical protein L198_00022 [Cryptococcus wingfieldii CBS 7118]